SGDGLIISDLDSALKNDHPWILEHITSYADFRGEPFTALNTALIRNGLYIEVKDHILLEKPVHFLHIAHPDGNAYQAFPRNLIKVGQNSQLSIITSYHHLSDAPYFHNSVSEIVLAENAMINEIKIQDESTKSYRIDRTQFYQKNRSIVNSVSIDLGGSLVRNNLGFSIDGENCETNLYGFYILSGEQHVDNHTNIDHLKPNCNSNELYKGILNDAARAVFSGTIYVARDAQKTNAFQSNKNLLLSEEAEIDSKPQLKIFADDVKCSHGATIGQLDEEALYYLRQRGIPEAGALTLLRSAFAGEIIEKISFGPVKKYIQDRIEHSLKNKFS
ncbi:MAG: Fe-S cluster assembly protein SufD, partial [Calditrichaeota bacterium]